MYCKKISSDENIKTQNILRGSLAVVVIVVAGQTVGGGARRSHDIRTPSLALSLVVVVIVVGVGCYGGGAGHICIVCTKR
jgi:hypothetical protein